MMIKLSKQIFLFTSPSFDFNKTFIINKDMKLVQEQENIIFMFQNCGAIRILRTYTKKYMKSF